MKFLKWWWKNGLGDAVAAAVFITVFIALWLISYAIQFKLWYLVLHENMTEITIIGGIVSFMSAVGICLLIGYFIDLRNKYLEDSDRGD